MSTSTERPLSGQVAFITGASSGIGLAIAEILYAQGAHLALAARRTEKLESVKASLLESKKGEGEILLFTLDVTQRDDVHNAVNETVSKLGRVDILINNAGVMLLTMMKNLNVEQWERMVDVNIKGVFNGISAVLSHMREAKRGHIINISSVADRVVFPGSAVYSATKAAVTIFSDGLRQELCAEGLPIHVTSISPGATVSELSTHISDEDVLNSPFPKMEFMSAEDIAEIILFVVTRHGRVNIDNILVKPVEQYR